GMGGGMPGMGGGMPGMGGGMPGMGDMDGMMSGIGGGDMFGVTGMTGSEAFTGGADFGVIDFFGGMFGGVEEAVFDIVDDYYVAEATPVVAAAAATNYMDLSDGGNTVTLDSSQFVNGGTLEGGDGADNVTISATAVNGTVDLDAGNDTLTLSSGTNTLDIKATENITGGTGIDKLTMLSTSGTTTITGSQGDDVITTASGTEVFKYTALNQIGDTIKGFTSGTDKFELSSSIFNGDANSNGGLDSLEYGANATSSTNSGVYWVRDTSTNDLYYDADANGTGTGTLVADLDTSVALGDITFV
ncbi:MAG: hypothetical protein ACKVIK_02355, partial [Rhodospirillales bacterium]